MNYLKIMVVVVVLLLSGCSSRTVEVQDSDTSIISKSDKAYIVFSWPKDRIYNKDYIELAELNQKQTDFKPIGAVEFGQKLIYEVDPGKHTFYGFVDGGLVSLVYSWIVDDLITIDAQSNKLYIVWIDSDITATTPKFVTFDANKDNIYSSFIDKDCSDAFLNENNFQQIDSVDEAIEIEDAPDYKNEHIKNYINKRLDMQIVCKYGIIKRADNKYMTNKKLLETTTVSLSKTEKDSFVENRADYLARITDKTRKKVQKSKVQKTLDSDEGVAISEIKRYLK